MLAAFGESGSRKPEGSLEKVPLCSWTWAWGPLPHNRPQRMTANAMAAAVTVPIAFQVPNTLEMRSAPLEGFDVCAAPPAPAVELVMVTVVTLPSKVLVTTVSVVAAAGEVVDTLEAAETNVVRFDDDDEEAEAEAEAPEGKSVKVEKMAGPGPVGKLPGSKGVPDGVEVLLLLLPGADDDAVGKSGRMVGNDSRFETASARL